MFTKRDIKPKIGIALFAIILFVVALRGCGGESGNFLSREGYIAPTVPVLIYDAPLGLREEEHYVVINLTSTQANALLKRFKAETALGSLGTTSSEMPPARTPNALWKPQTVKKYLSGGFKKISSYTCYCSYVFDTSKPGKTVLYFYAVSYFYE